MPPKKRKRFDLDELEAEISATEELIATLDDCVERCFRSGIRLDTFPENILIAVTVLKYGLQFVQDILLAFEAVPDNCGPWREEIIIQMLNFMQRTEDGVPRNSERASIVHSFLKIFSKRKKAKGPREATRTFSRILSNENTSPEVDSALQTPLLFSGSIAPPTNLCLVCGGNLHVNNKPTMVTLYHIDGPLPFVKVELRCRSCQINYGIAKYGNIMHGYRYYDQLGIIEASNTVYIDRLLMEMFVALRYA